MTIACPSFQRRRGRSNSGRGNCSSRVGEKRLMFVVMMAGRQTGGMKFWNPTGAGSGSRKK